MIYTTNAIESLHMQVRKVIKNRGHFPNEAAASKLIYLALRNIVKEWKRPPTPAFIPSSLIKTSSLVILVSLLTIDARADVSMPALFSDHMVLQAEVAAPVWGFADAGEKVTVTIGNQTKTTTADASGRWSLKLDELKSGDVAALIVKGKNTITINDVLIGEVWLCSGQSNMRFTVDGQDISFSGPLPAGHEIKGAEVICTFTHAEGLAAATGEITGFTLAGADKIWHPATARVQDGKVIVSSPEITAPIALRYGWADMPECNLINAAGLPASPFRTDDWTSTTAVTPPQLKKE